MNFETFLKGIGFILAAYLFYRVFLKGIQPATEENGYEGPTQANYIGLWGVVITLTFMGVWSIFDSCGSTS